MQAACVRPLLLEKVREWAAITRGCFPRAAEGEPRTRYERYAPGACGDSEQGFEWPGLKSAARAVEKVLRSYDQDVSRLVDVCRQAIAFDGLGDLAACLQAIAADGDVELVRVKNRYDPDYDGGQSGGYRDVCLNLRFRTAAAARLGVDAHVCEVQLMLRAVAELKTAEGHALYVAARGLRAD